MATTSLVGVRDREKGFEGSGMVVGMDWVLEPASGRCTWRVESQEPEMMRLCSRL